MITGGCDVGSFGLVENKVCCCVQKQLKGFDADGWETRSSAL